MPHSFNMIDLLMEDFDKQLGKQEALQEKIIPEVASQAEDSTPVEQGEDFSDQARVMLQVSAEAEELKDKEKEALVSEAKIQPLIHEKVTEKVIVEERLQERLEQEEVVVTNQEESQAEEMVIEETPQEDVEQKKEEVVAHQEENRAIPEEANENGAGLDKGERLEEHAKEQASQAMEPKEDVLEVPNASVQQHYNEQEESVGSSSSLIVVEAEEGQEEVISDSEQKEDVGEEGAEDSIVIVKADEESVKQVEEGEISQNFDVKEMEEAKEVEKAKDIEKTVEHEQSLAADLLVADEEQASKEDEAVKEEDKEALLHAIESLEQKEQEKQDMLHKLQGQKQAQKRQHQQEVEEASYLSKRQKQTHNAETETQEHHEQIEHVAHTLKERLGDTILAEICIKKLERVAEHKRHMPLEKLQQMIQHMPPPRGFLHGLNNAVKAGHAAIIAEAKPASPSAGVLVENFAVEPLVTSYEEGGAACLSILTEEDFFQGSDTYIAKAKAASSLPVLRKDFMIDPYQIVESRALGADCVLLILSVLNDQEAKALEQVAHQLHMDVLIEVHSEEELDRALTMKSTLIGINNRNLKDFTIDLALSEKLASRIPPNYTIVCESGIKTVEDIKRMEESFIYCFLIGETLMRSKDIAVELKSLVEARGEGA